MKHLNKALEILDAALEQNEKWREKWNKSA
jgi:hypothetical protein